MHTAYIDLDKNNGLGAVVKKDSLVLDAPCQSHLVTACRHANGRDWWLIKPGANLAKYYRLLFSPQGIDSLPYQTMTALPNNISAKSVHACFSPDGTKYAHFDADLGVWLYDFDRCTGDLSNRQLLVRIDSTGGSTYSGVAFSPNSRYLYTSQSDRVYQYDVFASNIEASMQTVAVWDGYMYGGIGTSFGIPQLAPNGKIYMIGNGSARHIHIIHSPDEGGVACNVEQHAIFLPTDYFWTMPNFPYFRLGAARGTACDSLGIETGVTVSTIETAPQGQAATLLTAFPNPTADACMLTLDGAGSSRGVLRLFSVTGILLETLENPFFSQNTYTVHLSTYPKGVYIAEYRAADGSLTQAKIVRQ